MTSAPREGQPCVYTDPSIIRRLALKRTKDLGEVRFARQKDCDQP